MKDAVCVSMTTAELDQIGREWIRQLGAESACYQYWAGDHTFPAYTCLSINDEVVHGIGTEHRKIAPSDVVSIDVVVRYQGFIGDNATTVAIPPVKAEDQALLSVTESALDYAIGLQSGNRVGDISNVWWSVMYGGIIMALFVTLSDTVSGFPCMKLHRSQTMGAVVKVLLK